jgi:hypothetical protein
MIKYEGVECTCSNALPYYTYMALVVDTVRIVWFVIVGPRAVSGVGKIMFSTFLNITHFYPALLLLVAVLLSEWECGLLLWTWSIISSIWRFGIIVSSCYLDYYYHFRNRSGNNLSRSHHYRHHYRKPPDLNQVGRAVG